MEILEVIAGLLELLAEVAVPLVEEWLVDRRM
jgi:hypothetical protein